MIEFLQRLFRGHICKWEERSIHPMRYGNNKTPSVIVVVLRCKECGRLKNHTIST